MKLSKPQKSHLLYFYLLYFFYIGSGAVFWPFLSNYLISKNISPTVLGTTIAAGTMVSLVGYNILGYLSDRYRRFDLMVLGMVTICFAAMVVIENSASVLVVIAAYLIYAFASSPTDSVIDTWAIESYEDDSIKRYFGIVRSGGSLGYGIITIISGLMIGNSNRFDKIIPFSYAAGLACIAYILYMRSNKKIKKFYRLNETVEKRKSRVWSDVRKLFAVREYSILLGICLLLHIPINIITMFTPHLFYSLGGGPTEQAVFFGLGALFEIPFFFLSSKLLSKIKTHSLILLASLAVIAKTVIFIVAKSPAMLMLASIFSTLEFAIFYPAIRFEVSKVAPEHLKTTAQTVISVFYSSIPTIIAGIIGGQMVELLGVKTSFTYAFCALVVVILCLTVYIAKPWRKQL